MELKLTKLEELEQEASSIQEMLEAGIPEDAESIVMAGNHLASLMARTGKMLADAKHHHNAKMRSDILDALRRIASEAPHATPTAVNQLMKTMGRDEQYMVDWIERLNRTCTHQLDWCRTLISKAKEEMRLSGMQPT